MTPILMIAACCGALLSSLFLYDAVSRFCLTLKPSNHGRLKIHPLLLSLAPVTTGAIALLFWMDSGYNPTLMRDSLISGVHLTLGAGFAGLIIIGNRFRPADGKPASHRIPRHHLYALIAISSVIFLWIPTIPEYASNSSFWLVSFVMIGSLVAVIGMPSSKFKNHFHHHLPAAPMSGHVKRKPDQGHELMQIGIWLTGFIAAVYVGKWAMDSTDEFLFDYWVMGLIVASIALAPLWRQAYRLTVAGQNVSAFHILTGGVFAYVAGAAGMLFLWSWISGLNIETGLDQASMILTSALLLYVAFQSREQEWHDNEAWIPAILCLMQFLAPLIIN